MNVRTLGNALGALALLVAGCGGTTNTDMGGGADLSAAPDLAMGDMAVSGDIAMLPPDMTIVYHPTILVEEVATTIVVGGMPVAAKAFLPVVINPDPGKSKPSDYDMTDMLGLGCSANHYMVGGGDNPTPDSDLGTVTLTGMTTGAALTGMMIPAEVNCAVVNGFYACGYGPLAGGMPSAADTNSTFFPGAAMMIPAGTAIRIKYTGGTLQGAYDSMDNLKSTDALTLAMGDDLTKIKYDPAANTTIHFTCDNKPNNCFDAVLVQLVASSVAPGGANYPGADYGTINCAGLANGGTIVIPKEAITAMYGGSAKIVSVMTRIVRGALPPSGQKDAKGNPVRLALGRGLMGFAPK